MVFGGSYEKVHRHVLVGKGAVHNGVDMNPSICLGLYLDRNRKSPPIIEMFYLTNRYGRQAGMHFDKFIPQILPKRQLPAILLVEKSILQEWLLVWTGSREGRGLWFLTVTYPVESNRWLKA